MTCNIAAWSGNNSQTREMALTNSTVLVVLVGETNWEEIKAQLDFIQAQQKVHTPKGLVNTFLKRYFELEYTTLHRYYENEIV